MPEDHRVRKVRFGDDEFLIPTNSVIRDHEVPDAYQKLVRRTFEQTRDILYYKFRREYYDSAKAAEKYPDPAAREEVMRERWIINYEKNWVTHLFSHPLEEEKLQSQSAMLERVAAERGERAWKVLTDDKEVVAVEERRLARMGSPVGDGGTRLDDPLAQARRRSKERAGVDGSHKGPEIG